ncbi:MAG: hypothetical protein JWO69_895 [Thermoleophilia bacterium]|nr:hypothetical protein [Thermoleophilia bacterium]
MNAKTRIAVGLGLLDIVRQASHAWSARQEAERERAAWGTGLRTDAARFAHDLRGRLHEHPLDMLPWRDSRPTMGDRLRAYVPIVAIVFAATAAVVVTARWVARQEHDIESDELATDSRVISAVRVGSQAIDAGVEKVVEGSKAGVVGAASTVAAGSSAVKQVAVHGAKEQLDERVVAPVKKKAIRYGVLGVLGLTIYVIVIAAIVQLVVESI